MASQAVGDPAITSRDDGLRLVLFGLGKDNGQSIRTLQPASIAGKDAHRLGPAYHLSRPPTLSYPVIPWLDHGISRSPCRRRIWGTPPLAPAGEDRIKSEHDVSG